MFSETQAATSEFEAHVPHADATFLVLKAHLVLESTLLKFIAARLPQPLYNEIKEAREASYAVRVLIARALASRDDVPLEKPEIIWPALKYLGSLRNQLAHNLEHAGSSVEDKMRNFISLVDPTGELFGTEYTKDHLFFVFRQAALYVNSLLTINRAPLAFSDIELDSP